MDHITLGFTVGAFGLIWHYVAGFISDYTGKLPTQVANIIAVGNQDLMTSTLHLMFIGVGASLLTRYVLRGNQLLNQVGLQV